MPNVIMPKMGDAMEEGTLLRWLKQVGDEIAVGDPLAEIETDKVSLEIEATEAGVLSKTYVDEGATVPIGTPIAAIGEESAEVAAQRAAAAAAAEAAPAEPAASSGTGAGGGSRQRRQRAGHGRCPGPGACAGDPGGSGNRLGRTAARLAIGEAPRRRARHRSLERDRHRPRWAHRARRHRRTAHRRAARLPCPGPDRGTRASASSGRRAGGATPGPSGRPAGVPRELSKIRRTTGRRMAESKAAAPHFYVTSEVDMAPAAALREQINAQAPDDAAKVSFNDLIIKAAALALREFPNLNASLENDQLVEHPNIDINVAVAIEGGLIAPFVPDADQKGLITIARMTKDLVGRARNGGLTPDEYQGGTFTISNLGMFDVGEFIAIINPPQAAILAIGSIMDVPVVEDGEIVPGKRMNITLSADHRVTDGAEVARYLQAVKRYLENPLTIAFA